PLPRHGRASRRHALLCPHVAVQAGRRPAELDVYYQILEPSQTGQAIAEVDALVQREALERLEALAAEVDAADGPALATRLKDELNRQVNRLGLMVIRCQLHVPGL